MALINRKIMSAAPNPYPGKYPTRVYLQGTDVPFEYQGKLDESVLGLVKQHIQNGGRMRYLRFYECDLNGFIHFSEGDSFKKAGFAQMYYPVPYFAITYGTPESRLYVMLNRVPVEIDGHRAYRSTFVDGQPWTPLWDRMALAAVKGRINFPWSLTNIDAVNTRVNEQSDKFYSCIFPKKVPEVVPAPPTEVVGTRVVNWLQAAEAPAPPAQPPETVGFAPNWGYNPTLPGPGQVTWATALAQAADAAAQNPEPNAMTAEQLRLIQQQFRER